MKKYWILIICVLFVAAAIIVWITGPVRVDWNMTAHLIAADGTAERSFPITIQGKIRDSKHSEKMVDLFLDIEVPRDFRYWFISSDSGNPAWKGTELKGGNPDDLRASDDTYDTETNRPRLCHYLINVKLGYFLAYWPDDGSYLVAATDPEVKTADVIAHFRTYCELWGIATGG